MAGTNKLAAGSTTACVTSGGGIAAAAAGIANGASNLTNSTNLDFFVTAVLVAAAASAPTQSTTISLYLVPKADGTNVAGVDASTPVFDPKYFAGNFAWPAASSASPQTMAIPGIPLEAYDYVPYLVNNMSPAISAGWTLTFYGTKAQY